MIYLLKYCWDWGMDGAGSDVLSVWTEPDTPNLIADILTRLYGCEDQYGQIWYEVQGIEFSDVSMYQVDNDGILLINEVGLPLTGEVQT